MEAVLWKNKCILRSKHPCESKLAHQMPQLHAAYCIEEILECLAASEKDNAVSIARELLTSLAYFELDSTHPLPDFAPEYTPEASLLAVAINLVGRGLPTRAPLSVARLVLKEAWPSAVENDDAQSGEIRFMLGQATAAFQQLLVRALHVIDPRIKGPQLAQISQGWIKSHEDASPVDYPLDSKAEHRFLNEIVAARCGVGVAQALLPQASLAAILQFGTSEAVSVAKQQVGAKPGAFVGQHVDFALPLPYQASVGGLGADTAGLILEVDGLHHTSPSQVIKDSARGKAAAAAHWQTNRLPVTAFSAYDAHLSALLHCAEHHPYCKALRLNTKDALHATEAGRRAEQAMLSPLLAARVHRGLLEAVAAGILQWNQPVWRVVIVERDVPGGHLGAEAFTDQLTNLWTLAGRRGSVPKLDVTVYVTPEYEQAELHRHAAVRRIADYLPSAGVELVLDVSMLLRPRLVEPVPVLPDTRRFVIRTAGLPTTPRRFLTAPLIKYAQLTEQNPEDEYEHFEQAEPVAALRFFLRDIFRKRDFRDGQLPILTHGLRAESVLGLLPTGGGKSLTYQLAALLQPGVCLVIDPIRSLMLDQFEGLERNWINAATYFNSSVTDQAIRRRRLSQLRWGEVLFFFASPERLQIQSFREQLQEMRPEPGRVGFSFCVVDEAHCVSEWGHDFRTQYLRLGETARRFCFTYDQKPIPLYALTATASFDVLADVQRELGGSLADTTDGAAPLAVVRIRTTQRRELNYRVVEVNQADKPKRLREVLNDAPKLLKQLSAIAEQPEPPGQELPATSPPKPLPTHFRPDIFFASDGKRYPNATMRYPNAVLIFCPHKTGKKGVKTVLADVSSLDGVRAGYFTGGDGTGDAAAKQAQAVLDFQRKFVSDQLNMLVATKAFGMGIDKPNVRLTVHYCYPGSIESLVQEAGRAGRDRAVALNYILFDPKDAGVNQQFFEKSFKGRPKEARMVHELLTEISMPSTGPLRRLHQALTEVLPDEEIQVPTSIWAKNGFTRLYLKKDRDTEYGFISLPDLTISLGTAAGEVGRAVLTQAVAFIEQYAPPAARTMAAALADWLREHPDQDSKPGILPHLRDAAAQGRTPGPLVVGFTNGEASRLAQQLSADGQRDPAVLEKLIEDAAVFAHGGQEFVRDFYDKASRTLPLDGPRFTAEDSALLDRRFEYLRDEQDTYKAVHRLSLLGVIRDYTLDYGAQTLELDLNPDALSSDEECLARLARYFQRYTTPKKARELAQAARHRPKGDSVLEKAIGALLDFVYEEVAKKRQQAMAEVASACQNTPSEGLGEFFDLYFNSKYARDKYLPADTGGNGSYFDSEIVWKYLGYMLNPPDGLGKERDNVQHLRGACARMLSSNAGSNGAVLLLDGFALAFLESVKRTPNPRALADATDKLNQGFARFREQEPPLNDEQLTDFFQEYLTHVRRVDERTAELIDQLVRDSLLLAAQLDWLRNFNASFDDRSRR